MLGCGWGFSLNAVLAWNMPDFMSAFNNTPIPMDCAPRQLVPAQAWALRIGAPAGGRCGTGAAPAGWLGCGGGLRAHKRALVRLADRP